MSKMQKSSLTVDGNSVHMSMPFAKVDKAQRLVSGWATLDNINTQGDIVLAEASAKAFARARGNIREMHQPIAVGKMVDFREDEFFYTDPSTGEGKFYRGIFVTAHVSEGAEDTWKKVLDGTLTGFSIGGEINEASNEFVKEANGGAGGNVRFIKDYDLTELSLVDNPANQLANVLSIQKNATGSVTVKAGEVVDAVVENVFICKSDNTVVVKAVDSETCPQCGIRMENAGWFESGANRAEKVQSIVTKFLTPADKEAAPISNDEGGVEMGKSADKSDATDKRVGIVNPSEEHPDGEKIEESDQVSVLVDAEEEESEGVDETAEAEGEEESESPEEVTDDETEISKKIDELHEAVKTSLEESKNETLEKVAELEKKVDEAAEAFLTKASELESKMGEFGEKLETSKSRLAEMESRLEKMNASEAFRKSADLEESTETVVQKDTSWNGAFSGGRSTRFSVDDLM